jgi:hypothetical protein
MGFVRRFWKWIAAAGVTAAVATPMALSQGGSIDVLVGSTPTPTATPTGTPDPTTAHAWIDTNGGTCTYNSTPATYSDAAACATIDAAWDLLSNGNTARIAAGSYTGQETVTGNKTADTYIIGQDGVSFSAGGAAADCSTGGQPYNESFLCLTANYIWLENVEIDTGTVHGQSNGGRITGNHITYRNVEIPGDFSSVYVVGTHFYWHGGYLMDMNEVGGARVGCGGDGEPIWIESSAQFTTIDGITLNPGVPDQTPCEGSEDGFHYEDIRVQSADDVTIKNVDFWSSPSAYGDKGSGCIFASSGSATGVQRLSVIGNICRFGTGNYAMQLGGALSSGTCVDWKFYYNQFQMAPSLTCDTDDTEWVGNTGVYTGCDGTGHSNVYQKSTGPGTGCAARSDTIVTGPDYVLNCGGGCDYNRGWENLGINETTARLESGSAAIDGAETPGASDICTGSLVNSLDILGRTRPSGSRCDAGPFEGIG